MSLPCGFLCLVNALQGHRGAGQAPAEDFWFSWLLLELMFLSSSALSVCCQTSAFLPILSVCSGSVLCVPGAVSGSVFPVLCSFALDAARRGDTPVGVAW